MTETALFERLAMAEPFPARGRIVALGGSHVEATGPSVALGSHCRLVSAHSAEPAGLGRVVAVHGAGVKLVPFEVSHALRVGDWVYEPDPGEGCLVGPAFAGRAIDALGYPIDGGGRIDGVAPQNMRTNVLDRIAPSQPLPTGVRAIDAFLTLGVGMRVGVFSASGVGKTRLIEQIIRQTPSDRTVACLVGERGREVDSLWRQIRSSRHLSRTSLVAATSDDSAPMRAQAVEQALGLAEYWRAQGENVLLVVDSVTRLAMALREMGLAAGEPPTMRAYTPGVFQTLPRIVERCGALRQGGSITAVFTILSETDDVDDPIVEVMKSILDGHVILSRRLAQMGHFPAIDVGRSISRLFDQLCDATHRSLATATRAKLARYEESRILVESGLYKPGGDRELDQAVAALPRINAFLRQDDGAPEQWPAMMAALRELGRA